ncbi:MAG: HNH endonuclease [Alcanivorax sp.]|nr:MAG: HNH endonuclease [Alcanivorax sp.]
MSHITNFLNFIRAFASAVVITLLLTALGIPSAIAQSPTVKMSNSKICHDKNSPYYARTKNYKSYDTLKACLDAGGRLPKGVRAPAETNKRPVVSSSSEYSREAFSHWIDEDGDCLNTRHELLLELSTGPVTMSENGCRVVRGRWNDPYSGDVLFDSSKMDIDHLVPLAWAWKRGASSWTEAKRKQFANDPVNLFAVTASLNRSKGAQGPDTWLPPNKAFQCQYITRYLRVLLKYDFNSNAVESIRNLRSKLCG